MLARNSVVLTTVSEFSAGALAKVLGISPGRFHVLPNGYEHALRWNPHRSAFYGGEPARPYVLLLGSWARHKNMDLILNLADRMDGLGLDIKLAGGGGYVFSTVHPTKQVPTNVHLLGNVSDDDLAALFQKAICLAFPSFLEGFGIPILEAMALGCPVVSSNAASMPEVCGTAALLAAPDNPEQWVTHFKSLAQSKSLGDELREKGRERATAFSWNRSARGYLDIMKAISASQ
ncbi:MAG: hypothetical protein NVSMB26_00170 [Beijerinckiaceae bacterium]